MAFRTNRSGTVNGSQHVDGTVPMFTLAQNLYDCLAGFPGDKGKQMPGCKISLWIELGNVKLCVNDDHFGRVGFAVLNTGMALGEAIEEVLDGDGLEWRPKGKKGA